MPSGPHCTGAPVPNGAPVLGQSLRGLLSKARKAFRGSHFSILPAAQARGLDTTPALVWHDSQTAWQVSRKLQLEWAKSGGKSATSSCISDPSDSDGIEVNSTWRRGAILTTQIRTWGPVRVAPGVGFAYLITDAPGNIRATTEIAGTNRSFRALFRFSLRPNRGPGPSNHADGRPRPPTSGGEALS